MKNYFTIKGYGESEIVIEKSKFLSCAIPVKDGEEAKQFIDARKKQFYDATHNVSAYVVGIKNKIERFSDDGEPSGTSGRPMLDLLKIKKLTNVCIVTTRYFGGIKLGKGGLVRAYGLSAKETIMAAGVIEREVNNILKISIDYSLIGKISRELEQRNIKIKDTIYTDKVEYQIYTPIEKTNTLRHDFIELSSASAEIEIGELVYLDVAKNVF